jgi:hypothetical protein
MNKSIPFYEIYFNYNKYWIILEMLIWNYELESDLE